LLCYSCGLRRSSQGGTSQGWCTRPPTTAATCWSISAWCRHCWPGSHRRTVAASNAIMRADKGHCNGGAIWHCGIIVAAMCNVKAIKMRGARIFSVLCASLQELNCHKESELTCNHTHVTCLIHSPHDLSRAHMHTRVAYATLFINSKFKLLNERHKDK
jgi:hypothetical protein